MYALVAIENTRCASVIVGVIQNANSHPTYSGCRTSLYGPGVANSLAVYGRPIK